MSKPVGGRLIVDVLEHYGLHGPQLLLASLAIALVIVWLSWRLAHRGMRAKRRQV